MQDSNVKDDLQEKDNSSERSALTSGGLSHRGRRHSGSHDLQGKRRYSGSDTLAMSKQGWERGYMEPHERFLQHGEDRGLVKKQYNVADRRGKEVEVKSQNPKNGGRKPRYNSVSAEDTTKTGERRHINNNQGRGQRKMTKEWKDSPSDKLAMSKQDWERGHMRSHEANARVCHGSENERGKSIGFRECGREGKSGEHYNRALVLGPITIDKLTNWAESANSGELILLMTLQKEELQTFLNKATIPRNCFLFLMKAIDLALKAQHQKESIKQLLDMFCSTHFFEHCTMYITEKQQLEHAWTDAEEIVKSFMNIFEAVLDKLPHFSLKCVTVITQLLNCVPLTQNVGTNKEFVDALTSLLQKAKDVYTADKERENKYNGRKFYRADDLESPSEDFRDLSVIPTKFDLQGTSTPFLRSAVISGTYQDIEHYLDVQFRLMRQDVILPLRQGIAEFKHSGCKTNFSSSDINFYYNVHIIDTMFIDGLDYVLHFDVSKLKNVRWEVSKRLIFGSLLCLSKDNFEKVIFATVSRYNREDLAKGIVIVNFQCDLDAVLNFTSHDVFIMAETTAYFESYVHVLKGLQEMGSYLPLQEYIVKCKKELKPPKYLLPSGGAVNLPVYNLTCLMKDNMDITVPVLTTVKWPSVDAMCLNESQREAAILALTKELAIIQGPPGTGKTYVGLKVMQILIENMTSNEEKSSGPILVVCYTNHALDQFLEGVLEFCDEGIIRVGGRSSSEKLERFNLKNCKSKSSVLWQLYENMKEVLEKINQCNNCITVIELDILPQQFLEIYMKPCHLKSLKSRESTDQRNVIRVWLNAPCDAISPAIEKMIHHHLTQLVLSWKNPSSYIKCKSNMNIFERASVYNACLKKYIQKFSNEKNRLSLDYARKKILPDSELQRVVPKVFFGDLDSLLSELKSDKKSIYNKVAYWLLGLHRDLHELLDDIQALTSKTHRNRVKTDIFDDPDASKHVLEQRVTDDVASSENIYNRGTKAAKNNIASIIQRAKMLGLEIDSVDNTGDEEGFQRVSHAKPLSFRNLQMKLRTSILMSEKEEDSIDNLWKLELNKRYDLYKLWLKRCKESQICRMKEFVEEYKSLSEQKKEAIRKEDRTVLSTAKVIGMTTTGAAKHQAVLQAIGCRIVVVEEAAEVLESHIVTTLSKNCQHLILIGDHQQLRPSTAVYQLAKDFGLDISLFERLIKNHVPHVLLKEQHRMRPEIAKFLRHIYPELQDHSSVSEYNHIQGVQKNVFFIQHEEEECHIDDSRSKANAHEAKYLVALCQYLLLQGYEPSQITILATYAGQVLMIKKTMHEAQIEQDVHVTAVDNFQGEENEIILLSLVRSNTSNKVGFLKVDNRVCVALSRAKIGLFVIGNISLLATQSKLWSKILKTAQEEEMFGEALPVVCPNHPEYKTCVITDEDFKKCPEGGCGRPCEYKLTCGHVCTKTCHGYDQDHTKYQCPKPVSKIKLLCGHENKVPCYLPEVKIVCQNPCEKKCNANHPCPLKCYEECVCKVMVNKTKLLCSHENEVPCYLPEDETVCQNQCTFVFECGHQCQDKCGVCNENQIHEEYQYEEYVCKVFVNKTKLLCSHENEVPCYLPEDEIVCQNQCTFVLECGHQCQDKCGDGTCRGQYWQCTSEVEHLWSCGHSRNVPCYKKPSEYPCEEPCKVVLDCGHTCVGSCSLCMQGAVHVMCGQKCDKLLPCGHKCTSFCGVECLSCSCHEKRTKYCSLQEACKLQKFMKLLDNSILMKFKEMDIFRLNSVELKAVSFQLKCHYILSKIFELAEYSNDSATLVNLNLLRDVVLVNVSDRMTEQFIREFSTELLRCFWLTNLYHLANQKDTELESNGISEVKKSIEALCCPRPEAAAFSQAKNVITTVRKCLSLEHSYLKFTEDLCTFLEQDWAKHENLMCDLLKEEIRILSHETTQKPLEPQKLMEKTSKSFERTRYRTSTSDQQECSEYLECDHPCPGKHDNCRKKGKHAKCICNVDYSWPCGHICKVPCYKKPTKYPCPSKCGCVLDCGHKCLGKCSECLQGTVHVACGERCDKILPCGHQCPSFCGALCLPCTENCPGECKHWACKKYKPATRCGHACVPCREECKYRCDHDKCSKTCIEECDIQPCDKKCQRRKNPCNHSCCGLCGELCVCKECDKVTPLDAYTENDELNHGEETVIAEDGPTKAKADENGIKERLLIKIPSCLHIFYVDELDKYVNSFEPGKASYIECPVCQKPIQKCLRYENINKERSWRREAEKNKIRKETAISPHDLKKLEQSQEMLEDSQLMSRFKITSQIKNKAEVDARSFVLKCAFVLSEIASLDKSENSTVSSQHINSLKDAMLNIRNRLTAQLKHEFTTELQRCFWLAQLQNLESLVNKVPSQLELDVIKCYETLSQPKPEMIVLEQAEKVTEILRRHIKELDTKTRASAKCILLEDSTERIMQILASEDKDMLCDLLQGKEEALDSFHEITEEHLELQMPASEITTKPLESFRYRKWEDGMGELSEGHRQVTTDVSTKNQAYINKRYSNGEHG